MGRTHNSLAPLTPLSLSAALRNPSLSLCPAPASLNESALLQQHSNCSCRPVTPQLQPATSLPLPSPPLPTPAHHAACNQANAIRIWRRFVWRILSKNCKRHLRLDFVAASLSSGTDTKTRHCCHISTLPHCHIATLCHCPSNAMQQQPLFPLGSNT